MADYGPSDPLSRRTLREMVAAVRSDWTVRAIEPTDRGSDVLYFLHVDPGEDGSSASGSEPPSEAEPASGSGSAGPESASDSSPTGPESGPDRESASGPRSAPAVDAIAENAGAEMEATAESPTGSASGETDGGSPGREIALKYCRFADPSSVLTEPRILSLVADQTAIPVPEVYGVVDGHDELPAPYFLMERCEGVVAADCHLDEEETAALARDAGRHLGRFHRIGRFEGFGTVEYADGEPRVADPRGAWADWFADVVEGPLDHLEDSRFADLVPPLRDYVADATERLRGTDLSPVPCHNEYRLGNVLVDPETRCTTAVLDWGAVVTAPAEYELVRTEQFFSDWAPLDAPIRERVREALYEGYDRTNELERDAAFDRRREWYLAATRIEAMRWLPYRLGDAEPSEREAAAAEHREFVTELVG